MQVNQTCSQNNFLLFPSMIFLSVLNITLAFNEMQKRNEMLMIARKKQSFMHENNLPQRVFMNSSGFKSFY